MKFIALLRGINVGGYHKVPMAELKNEMKRWGYTNVTTLLNSGNIIFDSPEENPEKNEINLAGLLEEHFGFPVPVIIRTVREMEDLVSNDPFEGIPVTKDTRLYLSFLKHSPEPPARLPWISPDNSFQIIEVRDKTICSVLDVSTSKTVKGMEELEKRFGKNITTRNLNTIVKICNSL